MRLFLIGLPGSGKSTIGRDLSVMLSLPLLDTDEEIIKREGISVEEIFEQKGEAYFRQLENSLLKELVLNFNGIISTGGGLPCFFDNMEIINKTGASVYLDVSPSTITTRLWSAENKQRPMLKGKNKEQLFDFINTKYNERYAYYSKASLVMKGDFIQAKEIIAELKTKQLI